MTTEVQSGVFSTGTGAVSSTLEISTLSFQPKLLILNWTGNTESSDAVGRQDRDCGFGWAIGAGSTNNMAVTNRSNDNVGTSAVSDYATDANCIALCDDAGSETGLMALQSFDADGFTLVVNDQMPYDLRVQFLAVGGSDILNVSAGYESAISATPHSITSLSYTPDAAFFMVFSDDNVLPDSGGSRGGPGFGAAVSSSKMATWAGSSFDALGTSETHAYIYDGESGSQAEFSTTQLLVRRRSILSSFNSDGFTLDVPESGGNWTLLWLTIEGGYWAVEGANTQTDTTTDITISGLSFAPKGGLVVSANRAKSTQDAATVPDALSFGVFDSTSSRRSMAYLDEDAKLTTEVTIAIDHDQVYLNIADDSTIEGSMDVKSMDSGGVTFIMDDADPSANYFFTVLVGEPETALEVNISPGLNNQRPGIKIL